MQYRLEAALDEAWILSENMGKRPIETFLSAFADAARISYTRVEQSLCDCSAVFESGADAEALCAKAQKCLDGMVGTCTVTPAEKSLHRLLRRSTGSTV